MKQLFTRVTLNLAIASVIVAICFYSFFTAYAASAEFDTVRTALRNGDPAAALATIERHLNSTDADKHLGYFQGLTAIDAGDIASAFRGFLTAAADSDREIAAASIARQAALARATGNLLYEKLLLNKLIADYPKTLAGIDAKIRLAEVSIETGDISTAADVMTRRSANGAKPERLDRRSKMLFAEAMLRSGEIETARSIFERMSAEITPDKQSDDTAIEAARLLDMLAVGSDGFGKTVPQLSVEQHLARGWAYLQERDMVNAKLHLDAVIATDPYGKAATDATLRIGRGYAQIGDHSEALKWYERVIERYPDSPQTKEALLLSASAYARVGRPKEAVNRYENFIAKYPNDEKLDRAYLNIVDVNRDLGEDQEALKWCERTRQAFGTGPVAAVATFTKARIHVARADWAEALKSLDETNGHSDLGGTKIPGGTTANEVKFLRAFTLERLGRFGEAIDIYLSFTPTLGDYFASRSVTRIAEMAAEPAAQAEIAQRLSKYAAAIEPAGGAKETLQRIDAARKVLVLSPSVELRQRASAIIEGLQRPFGTRTNDVFDQMFRERPESTAGVFRSIGAFADASAIDSVASISPEIAAMADRGDLAFAAGHDRSKRITGATFETSDRATLRLAFPVPYRAALLRHSRASGVDPRFMLAIMRQESGFKPDARSSVSARGLMQFMMPTAARSARQLAIDPLPIRHLYEPEASIMLGSVYLAELFAMFPNNPEAVAASYNGGEDNMKRWLARSRSTEPERFVPEVMFTQSKDYVYRVMGNYQVYQRLYDEDLRSIN